MKNPKANPKPDRCVIYIRVSSTKQTSDGAGLSSQERSCREYAERSGYEVDEVFSDVISGKAADRPGMNALLRFLRKVNGNQFSVVVDDITRFARDVSTHTSLRAKIMDCGAKIESPKQNFGEDAGGRFMEILFAAIAAHDREKNAEQSKSRTIARLKNGFWTFKAPMGYRYVKAPGGGKMLARDEPLASIITEALEGFALGRLQTQAEVKRFLDCKPEFPRAKGATEVKFDIVTALLTRLVYAGYLEKEDWGVPLTKAQHEPLISYETHLIIQDRLSDRQVAPARKDIDQDFPLRGFLICDACGYGLTACWSKSGTGTKYPYYLCHHKGCTERGKSARKEKVEQQFETILGSLVPSIETYEIAARMFKEAWEARADYSEIEAKRLRTRANQIAKEIETLLDRIVRTQSDVTVGAYEKRITELESERAVLGDTSEKIAVPQRSFDEMFELAMQFLANPYEIWKNGGIALKRTVLRLVFAAPLPFNRNQGVRTGEITFPFKALRFIETTESKMVPHDGLEPPTLSLRMMWASD